MFPYGATGNISSIDAYNVKVFNRKGVDKDERTRSIENEERARLLKDQQDEIAILKESAKNKASKIAVGKVSAVKIVGATRKLRLKRNRQLPRLGFIESLLKS